MQDNLLERFGHIVRELRLKHQLSQEELGELCFLHRTYISDVELGKRNVSLSNINKIAIALNISIADLFIEMDRKNEKF